MPTIMDYAADWRELPIWALLMLNDYAPAWKNYFLNFSHGYTSDAVRCIKVRIVFDHDAYEIWEVVPYYGITNLH